MQFVDADSIPKTGNALLDAHHRALAGAINTLYEVWKNWEDGAAVEHNLDGLLRDVEVHFTAEEIITRGANYQDWRKHETLHDALRDRMRTVAETAVEPDGRPKAPIEAFNFFDELIFEHEFLEDQDFWESFRRHALEPGRLKLVSWDSRLHSGEEETDTLHAGLIDLLNATHLAICEHQPIEVIAECGAAFRHALESHFVQEEDWSRLGDSPLLRQVRVGLGLVIADLEEALASLTANGDPRSLDRTLVNHARFWVLDHITYQHNTL